MELEPENNQTVEPQRIVEDGANENIIEPKRKKVKFMKILKGNKDIKETDY